MKPLSTSLLLILFSVSLMAQEDKKIFTCAVTDPTTVICNVRHPDSACINNRAEGCKTQILENIDWNARNEDGTRVFEEWLWEAPASLNARLIPSRPAVGQVLRATLTARGYVEPLASCDVLRWRRVEDWRKAHPGYDRIPLMVQQYPDECKTRYGGN